MRKRTLLNRLGIFATLPATIITAIASPIALSIPRTTAVTIQLFAAGRVTLKIDYVFVAPSANDASSYSFGTARIAVTDTEMTDGIIITTPYLFTGTAPAFTINSSA